jgi:hypothetical protein
MGKGDSQRCVVSTLLNSVGQSACIWQQSQVAPTCSARISHTQYTHNAMTSFTFPPLGLGTKFWVCFKIRSGGSAHL